MNRFTLATLLFMVLTVVTLCFMLDWTVSPDRVEARWLAPAVLAVGTFVCAAVLEEKK